MARPFSPYGTPSGTKSGLVQVAFSPVIGSLLLARFSLLICNEWNWTRRTERNLNLILDNIIQQDHEGIPIISASSGKPLPLALRTPHAAHTDGLRDRAAFAGPP